MMNMLHKDIGIFASNVQLTEQMIFLKLIAVQGKSAKNEQLLVSVMILLSKFGMQLRPKFFSKARKKCRQFNQEHRLATA